MKFDKSQFKIYRLVTFYKGARVKNALGTFPTSCTQHRCQSFIGSNGHTRSSTSARCYFRGAAVKVIVLLTVRPRLIRACNVGLIQA